MRWHVTTAIFAVFLAACSGAPTLVESEPRFAIPATPASVAGQGMAANATLAAAQAQQVAADIAAQDATAQVARVTADARATSDAYAWRATSTADALAMLQQQDAATATAQAAIGQATSEAQATAFAAVATRDAYAMSQDRAEAEATRKADQRNREEVRAWSLTAITSIFILALAVVIVSGVHLLFKVIAFSHLAKDTHAGPMTLANTRLEYDPRLLPAPVIDGDTVTELDPIGAIPFTANGRQQPPIITGRDDDPERTNRELVKWLLRESIKHLDETGGRRDVIPGHRHLSLNADTWTRAVNLLKDNGIVYTQPRSGTYFNVGWNVDIALRDVEMGRMDFSPTRQAVAN